MDAQREFFEQKKLIKEMTDKIDAGLRELADGQLSQAFVQFCKRATRLDQLTFEAEEEGDEDRARELHGEAWRADFQAQRVVVEQRRRGIPVSEFYCE